MIVDPELAMAIREQTSRVTYVSHPEVFFDVSAVNQYTRVGGVVLPQEVDLTIRDSRGETRRFRFKQIVFRPVPCQTRRFRGVALPGPGDAEKPIRRSGFDVAYWSIGLAGVALVTSLLLKRLGRDPRRPNGDS